MTPIYETKFRDENRRGFMVRIWKWQNNHGNARRSFECPPDYAATKTVISVPIGWRFDQEEYDFVLVNVYGEAVDAARAIGWAINDLNGFFVLEKSP